MIVMPSFLSARSAEDTVAVCDAIRDSENDSVVVDCSNLKFVDPFGIALLGATFNALQLQKRNVVVQNLSLSLQTYLSRMDVFKDVMLEGELPTSAGVRHDRSKDLVELTCIDNKNTVDSTASRLADTIVGNLDGVNPNEPADEMSGCNTFDRMTEPIRYALSELLENALTHAKNGGYAQAKVWVASQYYPWNDCIQLGIVDNGCGFLRSLEQHPKLKFKRHHDAILLALQPRISCNRDLQIGNESVNQGIGLTTTWRMAQITGGRLLLVSGDSFHDTSGKTGEFMGNNHWQGVAISLSCKRNRLASVRVRDLMPPIDTDTPVRLRFE